RKRGEARRDVLRGAARERRDPGVVARVRERGVERRKARQEEPERGRADRAPSRAARRQYGEGGDAPRGHGEMELHGDPEPGAEGREPSDPERSREQEEQNRRRERQRRRRPGDPAVEHGDGRRREHGGRDERWPRPERP